MMYNSPEESNDSEPVEVDVIEIDEETLQKMKEAKDAKMVTLASSIEGKLTTWAGRMSVKHDEMLRSWGLYLGSLATSTTVRSPDDPFNTKATKKTRPTVNIVRSKCDTAIAQTMAYQFAAGDKNWSIVPPSVVDDIHPEEIHQAGGDPNDPQAAEDLSTHKAAMMDAEIERHLSMSNYGIEARKAARNRVILGTGIMKGPTSVGRMRKIYEKSMTTDGKPIRIARWEEEKVPITYSVNPFYAFVGTGSTDIKDMDEFIEVHPYNRRQVQALSRNSAFDPDAIIKALEMEPKSYSNLPFTTENFLTQSGSNPDNRYYAIEYRGPLEPEDLDVMAIDPEDYGCDCDAIKYYAEVWVLNGQVIRLSLESSDPNYRLPYNMSVWEEDPSAPLGFGLPLLIADPARVVNETYKMMLDNAGVSAGPQVVVDTTLIKPASGGLECTPFKTWYCTEYGADISKAIKFFMPDNAYEGLSSLFMLAKNLADEESSISAFQAGTNVPTGAEDMNATGLAIFNENASSPLFYKSEQWDDAITSPLIESFYDWEMLYNPNDSIKANFDVDVRTATSMMRDSVDQTKLDKLRAEAAQGSPVGEWINMDELVVASLLAAKLPYKNIIKTKEEVEKDRANKPPPPPDPNLIKAQADQLRAQNEKERLEMEKQRGAAETALKYQEAQWEFQAKMRTDDIRKQEAQASALKAQYNYMAEMAQLASRSENDRARILADLSKFNARLQTDKFLAGVDTAVQTKKMDQTDQELELKRQGKTGV